MGVPALTYEQPIEGLNYWVIDNALPNAQAISNRCFNTRKWALGFPYTQEKWPGKRIHHALKKSELALIEEKVKDCLKLNHLWVAQTHDGLTLDCNVAQKVGAKEAGPLPHTDSLNLCQYAAILYLSPHPDPDGGTAFYRLRYPNGAAGGNLVMPPYKNLRDALRVQSLPPQAWYEEVRVENRFNRLLIYKANMVHSATKYFGEFKRDKRLTCVFFWMADNLPH